MGPVGLLLALVSGNLQTFSCYGLVTNWQFFACGAPFVGRSPRTPPTDALSYRGGREKAAKNGRAPSQKHFPPQKYSALTETGKVVSLAQAPAKWSVWAPF